MTAALTDRQEKGVTLRPVAERSLTRRLLYWAEQKPQADAVRCAATSRSLSYSELIDRGLGFAALLRSAGLGVGEHIGIMLPNGLDWVVSWAGAMIGGFVDVGIDPESKAAMLRHYVSSSDVKILVCNPEQAETIRDAGLDDLPLVIWGEGSPVDASTRVPEVLTAGKNQVVHRDPRADMSIRFTSGTTGPAKPAMLTQSHLEVWASHFVELMQITDEDVLYTPFPLSHHLASVMGVLAMTFAGGTCVIDARFSLSRFWDTVRREKATRLHVLQPVINLLMAKPESPSDRDHSARLAYIGVPGSGFEERFGVELLIAYGLTEGSMLAYRRPGDPGPQLATSCAIGGQVLGRSNPHFEVQVLDDWDQPCTIGEKGNICFRPRTPYTALQQYYNYEAATVKASSNLWFHTGDIGCFDEENYLHFFGRSGDTIRRKGHNIPIFHVEEAARMCTGVREAFVIPVAAPGNEFDLKLILIPQGEVRDLDPRSVIERLTLELPPIWVPSFIEVREEVPRTRTYKVLKSALREEGVNGLTPGTLRTSDWSPALGSRQS
ncbi:hypothetical protein DC347_19375 [Pseudarthrobacter sp. AG30]|uniref:AMP-binding protein n=1 Tax=Pseudarthrobacter sp. AG30 TaxID=2249742 RepID=UPI000D6E5B34|nr:AMP-binding protein [Pseudarthrobacter sp. AG30]RAX15117.1 hypothetical protein DC347_19375 [Pseudarthrobacter sp. AG30]